MHFICIWKNCSINLLVSDTHTLPIQIKPFITFYHFIISMNYAKACNEFAGPVFASLRQWATQLFLKKMLQLRRADGNTAPDFTGLRLQSQTFRSTNWLMSNIIVIFAIILRMHLKYSAYQPQPKYVKLNKQRNS